jgi:hypothetical protein
MKVAIALALSCVIGLSACTTASPAAPGAATCACGKQASECGCEKCKGGSGAHCECGKEAAAHKGHAHGGGHSCGGH